MSKLMTETLEEFAVTGILVCKIKLQRKIFISTSKRTFRVFKLTCFTRANIILICNGVSTVCYYYGEKLNFFCEPGLLPTYLSGQKN